MGTRIPFSSPDWWSSITEPRPFLVRLARFVDNAAGSPIGSRLIDKLPEEAASSRCFFSQPTCSKPFCLWYLSLFSAQCRPRFCFSLYVPEADSGNGHALSRTGLVENCFLLRIEAFSFF